MSRLVTQQTEVVLPGVVASLVTAERDTCYSRGTLVTAEGTLVIVEWDSGYSREGLLLQPRGTLVTAERDSRYSRGDSVTAERGSGYS
jgi:hypothetical protein